MGESGSLVAVNRAFRACDPRVTQDLGHEVASGLSFSRYQSSDSKSFFSRYSGFPPLSKSTLSQIHPAAASGILLFH